MENFRDIKAEQRLNGRIHVVFDRAYSGRPSFLVRVSFVSLIHSVDVRRVVSLPVIASVNEHLHPLICIILGSEWKGNSKLHSPLRVLLSHHFPLSLSLI